MGYDSERCMALWDKTADNLHEAAAAPSLGSDVGVLRASASFGLCVVGYALAMALLGDRLKLSHEAGALFAGLVLVGTPHVDKAKRAVSRRASSRRHRARHYLAASLKAEL